MKLTTGTLEKDFYYISAGDVGLICRGISEMKRKAEEGGWEERVERCDRLLNSLDPDDEIAVHFPLSELDGPFEYEQ